MQQQRGAEPLPLPLLADRPICCGWVGRDRAALHARIHELAHVGGLPPMRVPIDMNLSTYRLTTDDEIMVVSGESSGELELDDPVPRRTIRTSHRVTVPPQHI